jgi:hypothetical protein
MILNVYECWDESCELIEKIEWMRPLFSFVLCESGSFCFADVSPIESRGPAGFPAIAFTDPAKSQAKNGL